jgi:hypothetical protein
MALQRANRQFEFLPIALRINAAAMNNIGPVAKTPSQ